MTDTTSTTPNPCAVCGDEPGMRHNMSSTTLYGVHPHQPKPTWTPQPGERVLAVRHFWNDEPDQEATYSHPHPEQDAHWVTLDGHGFPRLYAEVRPVPLRVGDVIEPGDPRAGVGVSAERTEDGKLRIVGLPDDPATPTPVGQLAERVRRSLRAYKGGGLDPEQMARDAGVALPPRRVVLRVSFVLDDPLGLHPAGYGTSAIRRSLDRSVISEVEITDATEEA